MIWLRRIISIPLLILFVGLFVSTFSVFTSIDLLLDMGFVKQNLVKHGIYEAQLRRALSNSMSRTINSWGTYHGYSTGDWLGLEIDSKRFSEATGRSIPMDLIHGETERAIEEILRYLKRDQGEFDLNIDTTKIIESTLVNLVNTLYRENILDLYTTSLLSTDSIMNLSVGDKNIDIGADINRIFTDSISDKWLADQIIAAIPEIVPYLMGQSDTFSILVKFDGVFENSGTIYIDDVDNETRVYWYKYISDLLVADYIERYIVEPLEIQFLFGPPIILSVDELRSIVNETIASKSEDGFNNHQFLDSLALYFMGYSDEFELTIDFGEFSSAAIDPTLDIIKAKLLKSALEESGGSILQGMITFLVDQYRYPIEKTISDLMPHDFVFTEDDLVSALSGTNDGMEILRSIEALRDVFREGFVYTDQDLKSQLGSNGAVRLNEIRDSLKIVSSYDEKDMSRNLIEFGDFDQAQIERLRDILSKNHSRVIVMQLMSLLLVFVVGFLAARDYVNKLRVILVTAFIASSVLLVVVISADAVLSSRIISLIGDLEKEISDYTYQGDLADFFIGNVTVDYTIATIYIIDNFRISLIDNIKGFAVPCMAFTAGSFIVSYFVTGLSGLKKSA